MLDKIKRKLYKLNEYNNSLKNQRFITNKIILHIN